MVQYDMLITDNTRTQPHFDIDISSKIKFCMYHAHMVNTDNPGSYHVEFNKALKNEEPIRDKSSIGPTIKTNT
ncbi:hypothetical protein E2C01_042105 [Portunus trituberculatus]|uniref:Uncharacterized protein n=1 Tax=Portunus trituberculatus TaxID=210409 RepID=A0A5B7FSI3_PORTR|nr:hypothetical protein [Portunus trituberculatus]